MDSPGSRPAEGHRWRRQRTDWYYIAGRGAHGSQFIRASRTNCQPAESSGIPHTKGMTPDREVVPAESEFAGSDQEGSDQEEGEITQTEGEGSGTFTQMRPRDSDSGSDETTPGRESWRTGASGTQHAPPPGPG